MYNRPFDGNEPINYVLAKLVSNSPFCAYFWLFQK